MYSCRVTWPTRDTGVRSGTALVQKEKYWTTLNITQLHKKNGVTTSVGTPAGQDGVHARKDGRQTGKDKYGEDEKAWREEMVAMQGKMDANTKAWLEEDRTGPEAAQQEVLVEDATVMPVSEPKKNRRKDRGLAA
jgi:hypothetical protein